jgi:hypothetical protein
MPADGREVLPDDAYRAGQCAIEMPEFRVHRGATVSAGAAGR